eukprot:Gb_09100 [translate_table: standard]
MMMLKIIQEKQGHRKSKAGKLRKLTFTKAALAANVAPETTDNTSSPAKYFELAVEACTHFWGTVLQWWASPKAQDGMLDSSLKIQWYTGLRIDDEKSKAFILQKEKCVVCLEGKGVKFMVPCDGCKRYFHGDCIETRFVQLSEASVGGGHNNHRRNARVLLSLKTRRKFAVRGHLVLSVMGFGGRKICRRMTESIRGIFP